MSREQWRKSSYSGTNGECVEVALTDTATLVRDTKQRAAGHLIVGEKEWTGFVAAVKSGQLNL